MKKQILRLCSITSVKFMCLTYFKPRMILFLDK